MRKPRAHFVVTVSTVGLAACTTGPTGYNPPPPPTITTAPTATAPSATAPVATAPAPTASVALREPQGQIDWMAYSQQLNPSDEEGRTIYRAGNHCYVELPFDEPPQAVVPPPTKSVACPAAMHHPAWAACSGGQIRAKADRSECLCSLFGNPPPPPKLLDCP